MAKACRQLTIVPLIDEVKTAGFYVDFCSLVYVRPFLWGFCSLM